MRKVLYLTIALIALCFLYYYGNEIAYKMKAKTAHRRIEEYLKKADTLNAVVGHGIKRDTLNR